MPPKRTLNPKRQTKLNFSPAPSSSSAAAHLSPQVRDRTSAVTYDGSPSRPSKKRKLDFGTARGTKALSSDSDSDLPIGRSHGLPTPKKSFQAADETEVSPEQMRRQMRMGMSSPTHPHGMFGSSDNDVMLSMSSSSSRSDDQRQPYSQSRKKTRKRDKKTAKRAKAQEEDSEDQGHKTPSKRTKFQEYSEEQVHKEPSRLQTGRKQNPAQSRDSSSDEAPVIKHTRSAKKKPLAELSSDTDSVLGRRIQSKSAAPKSESSDNDKMPDTTPPRRTGRSAPRYRRSNSFDVPDEVVELEESDEDDVPRSANRRLIRKRPTTSEDEDEESEEEVKTPGRRLIRKKDQRRDRQEQEDLEEDLDFLKSSPPPDKGRLRNRTGKPLNARQKALETLKSRRAGGSNQPTSSAPSKAVLDSDSELEIVDNEDEVEDVEEDEEDDNDEPQPYYPHASAMDMFQEDNDDEGFIVDEDDHGDDSLGAPAELLDVPIQFSSLSRAKPRELFKYAVEWMVQRKINPAFSSTDEIYGLTFRKLDDEVKGLANSKFSSSVWTPDFTRALRARPTIHIDEIGRHVRDIMMPHCEACNRKTHPATWNISFEGKPYNKDTLEPLGEDSDSASTSSSSDSDSSSPQPTRTGTSKPTYDAHGEHLPPISRVFTVGSTCKNNAQMAHTLHHWRHHLNSWVVDYLVRTGHCTPEKLVERDSWSQRKRMKYANKIVDKMEEVGEIKKLHRLYKEQVDYALEARNEGRFVR